MHGRRAAVLAQEDLPDAHVSIVRLPTRAPAFWRRAVAASIVEVFESVRFQLPVGVPAKGESSMERH